MKKVLITILLITLTILMTSCGSSSRPTEYQSVSLETIAKEVDSNMARATKTYVGNCYEFKAELSYISEDLKTITAYEIDPDKDLGVQISGSILDKEDRDILLNANDGDIITIKGKIKDIGLGFMISAELTMDVYEISIN